MHHFHCIFFALLAQVKNAQARKPGSSGKFTRNPDGEWQWESDDEDNDNRGTPSAAGATPSYPPPTAQGKPPTPLQLF